MIEAFYFFNPNFMVNLRDYIKPAQLHGFIALRCGKVVSKSTLEAKLSIENWKLDGYVGYVATDIYGLIGTSRCRDFR